MSAPADATEERVIRIDLEYDGTDFVGWQAQARGRSVQGELARALTTFLQVETVPVGAGRTDAGTHAMGQVAHFRTATTHPPKRMQQALNGLLPPDVAVTACTEVDDGFHARYSAIGKCYRYRIASARSPLERRRVWTLYRPLNFERLALAARAIPGTHHFGAFCKQDPVPDRFDCHIYRSEWTRAGRELVFEIEGNRFLRHMVRILVGTMVEIGLSRRPVEDLSGLLQEAGAGADPLTCRRRAGATAPAVGLCLIRVHYPGLGIPDPGQRPESAPA